jgi:RNA polymerase sigma-B factor
MTDEEVGDLPDEMSDDLQDLELFREFARTKRRSTRNALVERHMGLAVHIAKRYSRGREPDDDLRQVAMVGLVKSVDRFDPEFGAGFSTFAGRTIEGELKRHFRDKSWTVKVPRSGKELHLLVRQAADELEQVNGRSPSVALIADHLQVERDDVVRGLAASAAATVATLDAPTDRDDASGGGDREAALAADDRSIEDAENAHVVEQLMARLPHREREIVRLRFFERKSQSEIAEIMGVSQMHVSRLLRHSFESMRSMMTEPIERPEPPA